MEPTITFAVVIAIVVGVVQAIKLAKIIPVRFTFLLSLLIGVAVVGIWGEWSGEGVLTGLIAGLSASGLWSGVKNSFF